MSNCGRFQPPPTFVMKRPPQTWSMVAHCLATMIGCTVGKWCRPRHTPSSAPPRPGPRDPSGQPRGRHVRPGGLEQLRRRCHHRYEIGAEQAELQTGWGCSTPDSSTSPPPPLPIRSLFQRCFVVQNWRPCQPGRLRYLIARAASGPGSNPARVSSSAAAIAAVPAKSWSRATSAPAPGTPSAKSPPFR